MDKSFCEYIVDIHKDPLAIPEALKVREYLALKVHIDGCENCSRLVDEVIEKGKDLPKRPDPSSLN